MVNHNPQVMGGTPIAPVSASPVVAPQYVATAPQFIQPQMVSMPQQPIMQYQTPVNTAVEAQNNQLSQQTESNEQIEQTTLNTSEQQSANIQSSNSELQYSNIVPVTNEDEVSLYPVAKGMTVGLINYQMMTLYLKTNDMSGNISYEIFDLSKKKSTPIESASSKMQNDEETINVESQVDKTDLSGYVKSEDLNGIIMDCLAEYFEANSIDDTPNAKSSPKNNAELEENKVKKTRSMTKKVSKSE